MSQVPCLCGAHVCRYIVVYASGDLESTLSVVSQELFGFF